MKRLVLIALILVAPLVAAAGEWAVIAYQIDGVATGAVAPAVYTNQIGTRGQVESVIFDYISGGNPTADVTVATDGGRGTGPARTILQETGVTADFEHPVRLPCYLATGVSMASSNQFTRPTLVDDYVTITISNANVAAVTAKVYVVIQAE